MTTRRNQPELRAKQWMTIDFFQVAADAGGPDAFARVLDEILNKRRDRRSGDVKGQPFAIYEIASDRSFIEGEIGRLRATGAPFLGTRAGERVPVALRNDQFIAECTAFLYDRDTSVLGIHTTMEGVSASKFAGFCDLMAQRPDDQEFVLLPILRTDTQRNLRSITDFKKIEVRLATSRNSAPVDTNQTTRSFVRGARQLGGDKVDIIIGTERGYNHTLDADGTRALIRSAQANEATVLVVSGRAAGDRSMTLDLIEDRLRERRAVDIRGRSASYEIRRNTVKTAYEANLETFRALDRAE